MRIRGVWRDLFDREKWPEGEWDHEPDKVEWVDDDTGLPCIIHRGRSGAWCGYVAVPPDHPLHGVSYSEGPDSYIDVHGGLTYSAPCGEHPDDEHDGFGVCHMPEEGQPADVWWFGFDTAHFMDLQPGLMWVHEAVREEGIKKGHYPPDFDMGETYKNQQYVMEECARLAKQLADMSRPTTTS